MPNEPTARDAELRQMLVATAASAPTHSPRRRNFVSLLIAFVAAGALTGGAVSAAALTSPAAMPTPISTINVEEIARGIVYDDTRLFGTPYILTGEGETDVILGTPPDGATELAIAFNCLDAASYDIAINGAHYSSVTCDEESTARAGGGFHVPIDPARDSDHRLVIEAAEGDRYAVWASWVAPAIPGEPSSAQRDALADGVVTEAEYRAGFDRYRQCMADAGYPLGSVNESDTVISYENSAEAVQSGKEGHCYAAEFAELDMQWQVANQ